MKNLTFDEVQKEATDYSFKNFGKHYGTGYRNLLGVTEEIGELNEAVILKQLSKANGELNHAHLKGEQNIRHTPEEILQKKKDAVGDIIIFLANYCDSQELFMSDCVNVALEEIRKRDYTK